MPQKKIKFLVWLDRLISSRNFLIFIYAWFFFQAVYMAVSIRLGISPDEVYHYSFIQLFAKNGWLPFIHDQTGYYFLGEVSRLPSFLYQYLLSIPYHFVSFSSHSLVILRVINIGFGIGSLYFMGRVADKLKVSRLVKNLSLFMLANTLMFVFLASMLNYDNLLVLLSLISFELLLTILSGKTRAVQILSLFAVILSGLMVVKNFIPIAVSVVIILAFAWAGDFKKVWAQFKSSWNKNSKLNIFLSVILVCLTALFIQRYMVNAVEYHALSPKCTKVNTLSQCEQSALFVRDVSFENKPNTLPLTPLGDYLYSWSKLMDNRVFGIFGHKSTDPTRLIYIWSQVLILLSIIAIIRKFDWRQKNISVLLFISAFYLLALIVTDYHGYKHSGIIGLAVQGRYLFPILPVLYIVSNYYIFQLLRKNYLQVAYICITLAVFITAGLPSYLIKTDRSWYTDRTASLNQSLHNNLDKAYGNIK